MLIHFIITIVIFYSILYYAFIVLNPIKAALAFA